MLEANIRVRCKCTPGIHRDDKTITSNTNLMGGFDTEVYFIRLNSCTQSKLQKASFDK